MGPAQSARVPGASPAVEQFALLLRGLKGRHGVSVRELAARAGFGKSSIDSALQGRVLPRWEVAEAIIQALDGDEDLLRRARQQHVAAKASLSRPPSFELAWLTDITDLAAIDHISPVELYRRALADPVVDTGPAADRQGPEAAMQAAWEILARVVGRARAVLYNDFASSWTSDVKETVENLARDGLLPHTAQVAMTELHTALVTLRSGGAFGRTLPGTAAAITFIDRAWRLCELIDAMPAIAGAAR